MFYRFNPLKYINYYNTLVIVLFLSTLMLPLLWTVSGGNLIWIFTCIVLWGIGVFVVYYPFLEYVFPLMITRTGTFLLGVILALFTLWLNSSVIFSLLIDQDIQMLLNHFILTRSVPEFGLMIIGYIMAAGLFVQSLNLDPSFAMDRRRSFFFSLYPNTLSKLLIQDYLIELILVFALPFLLLFWDDLTFSTRLVLATISTIIGMTLFFHKLSIPLMQQRLVFSLLSVTAIVIINGTVFNLIGMHNIPASHLTSRISSTEILYDGDARKMHNPAFQFANNGKSDETTIYRILATLPDLGIYLGYKIDAVPSDSVRIESTHDQYTVYDKFNQELTHIKK